MGVGVSITSPDLDHLIADMAAAPARVTASLSRTVAAATSDVQADAKRFAPVRTGFLRENIDVENEGLTGSVISRAPYSEYVEDGTSDTAPQPFMRPALARNVERFVNNLADDGEGVL